MTARRLPRGARWAAIALLGMGLVAGFGLNDMGFFSSDERDLRRLLGDGGASLVDDAEVAAWQPDPDHKASAYYLLRRVDETAFRRLTQGLGLEVQPTTALEEAVWKLPPGTALPGWAAPAVPAGAGLQARGTIGSGNAWLRWHAGTLFGVVLRAS